MGSLRGIAAGIRRIEALTGPVAEVYMREREKLLAQASEVLKTTPDTLIKRLDSLLEEKKRLERELKALQKERASGSSISKESAQEIKTIASVRFLGRALEDVNPGDLKSIADEMKKRIGSGIVAIAASKEGKASLVVGVTPDLTPRFNAVDLVRAGAEALGGQGGGGRPDLAQAGGPCWDHLEASLQAIEERLK